MGRKGTKDVRGRRQAKCMSTDPAARTCGLELSVRSGQVSMASLKVQLLEGSSSWLRRYGRCTYGRRYTHERHPRQ